MEKDCEKLDIKEVADVMWSNSLITEEAGTACAELEDMSSKRLTRAIRELDIDTELLKDKLRKANEFESPDILQEIFLELSTKAFESGMHIDGIDAIVRAMQGYSNNTIARNIKGEPYSRLLATALYNLPKQYKRDINKIPQKLADAHITLNEHVDFLIQKNNRASKRIDECSSIGHHALDWHVQLIPEDLLKKSKERVAAIALDIVSRFNEDAPVKRWMPYYRKELSELGGWKNNMGYAGLRAYTEISGNIPDINIMILPADLEYGEVSSEPPPGHISDDGNTESVQIGTHPDKLDPQELTLRMNILFDRYGISDTVNIEKIKKWVYESEGQPDEASRKFHAKFIELFPKIMMQQKEAFLEIIGTAADAWNAFPHKELGGKSPLEMIADAKNKTK
jgi:hypothetical protein